MILAASAGGRERWKNKGGVACFGDSLIQGFPFGPRYSWTAAAEEGTDLRLINYGVCGDCCDDIFYRLRTALLPAHIRHIIFLGGANDLLQQRPQKGLLAGLWQPVLLEGARSAMQTEQALAALGVTARAVEPLTPARHVFSHLVWEMDGFACAAQSCAPPPGCVWAGRAEVDGVYTLPGAFKAYRPVLKKYL